MRRYLCLFFPRWPIQCLRRRMPETLGKACALFERSQHGAHVAVCSAEANTKGVCAGSTVADAKAILPDLLLYEIDHAECLESLKRLCLWSTRYSPLAAIEPAGEHICYPQSLLLDVTGCESVFGGEDTILELAHHALKRLGLKARMAICSTHAAAWAMAHFGPISSRVPLGDNYLNESLSLLPLAALRLPGEIVSDFRTVGLHKIGDVLRIPRNAIPSRFGKTVLDRLDHAFGVRPEKFVPLRTPPQFRVAKAFQYPVSNTEVLFKILEQMVQRLSDELQKAERGARQIECWLHHEIAEPVFVDVALHKCSAGKKHLWQLLRTRLEDHFRERPASKKKQKRPRKFDVEHLDRVIEVDESVDALALHVTASEPLHDKQMPLFDSKQTGESEDFNLLLDRLVTKLGHSAVCKVELQDDPLPERAYRLVPLDEVKATATVQSASKLLPERPITLFPSPLPIEMKERCFVSSGQCFNFQDVQSLERVESGWWRETDQRRDYYVVRCDNGGRYWVFNDLIRNEWFLHGSFD
ncbi:DNA polymerase Y family protein [Oscillatoria laete-virens NRMC-F 0139]|nr:DNA polymerase Y family protein [Oscillatoria laete-virens]MDL5054097.1 DNA polymerase Y family protein [Oscillatoria laete-virens NRMC-F 0139]